MAARSPAGATAHRAQRLVREAPARRSVGGAIALFETSLAPRLAVLAPSMPAAVHSMGGWLFDQAMAGWAAEVGTAARGDGRAALILGVRARDLTAVLAGPLPRPWVQSVGVHVDAYSRDPRVRRAVRAASQDGSAEILFAGGPPPAEFAHAEPVRYRLSLAARAFKSHAVAALSPPVSAAEQDGTVDPDPDVEVFSRVPARTTAAEG